MMWLMLQRSHGGIRLLLSLLPLWVVKVGPACEPRLLCTALDLMESHSMLSNVLIFAHCHKLTLS